MHEQGSARGVEGQAIVGLFGIEEDARAGSQHEALVRSSLGVAGRRRPEGCDVSRDSAQRAVGGEEGDLRRVLGFDRIRRALRNCGEDAGEEAYLLP